jgi:hypothetical protein
MVVVINKVFLLNSNSLIILRRSLPTQNGEEWSGALVILVIDTVVSSWDCGIELFLVEVELGGCITFLLLVFSVILRHSLFTDSQSISTLILYLEKLLICHACFKVTTALII